MVYGKDAFGSVCPLKSNLPSFISILSLGFDVFFTIQLNVPETILLTPGTSSYLNIFICPEFSEER